MLDLENGIESLTNFKRNTADYLQPLHQTGTPLVQPRGAGATPRCHAPKTAKSIANVIYVNNFRSVWYSSTRAIWNQDM